jgi:hypothetical protein
LRIPTALGNLVAVSRKDLDQRGAVRRAVVEQAMQQEYVEEPYRFRR